MTELAPRACIVCGKPADLTKPADGNWTYLAGAVPLGALACSEACTETAKRRWRDTGRVDGKAGV